MSTQRSLHPSPFLASPQLLFWLLFYPSAWRQYVQGIDPALPPDFALCRLNKAQWRHPDLQYLTGVIHLAAPLCVGALVFFSLWFMTEGSLLQGSDHLAIRGLIYSFVLSLAMSLTGAILVSAAFGAVAGMLGGLLTGLFFTDNPDFWPDLAILGGIFAASVACSVLWGLAAQKIPRSGQKSPAKLKLFAGLLAGGLIPAGILTVCVIAVPWLLNRLSTPYFNDPYTFGLALGIGGILYFYLHSKLWPGIVACAFFAVISSFVKSSDVIRADDSFWLGGVFKPFIGGLSNGLVFMLLFSLPYLITRRFTASPRAGILAGLLVSCGTYLVLFFFSGNGNPAMIPWVFLVAGAGFSQRWWHPLGPLLADFFKTAFFKPNFYLSRDAFESITVPSQPIRTIREAEKSSRFQRAAFNHLTEPLFSIAEKTVEALRKKTNTARRQLAYEAGQLADFTASDGQIPNHYVLGNPLITPEQQEIFVGRQDIAAEIQRYFSTGVPVFLYGQRRVGKTSLLYRLGYFLNEQQAQPRRLSLFYWLNRLFRRTRHSESDQHLVFVIDLQGLTAEADSGAEFVRQLSRSMKKSAKKTMGADLPELTSQELQNAPFTKFDEWLDEVEAAIPKTMLVLAFDEFEALAQAFAGKRLNKNIVLGRLRNIIQHRPRFKVVIAGSHLLEEYPDWTSYLNNTVAIRVSYLAENEARKLIERPYRSFALQYEPGAVQHMLALTGCHPAFLQALCSEIINLINEENEENEQKRDTPRYTVRIADVETALPRVLERTRFIFSHLLAVSGDKKTLLHFIAAQGKNKAVNKETLRKTFPSLPALDKSLDELVEQGVLEQSPPGYLFCLEFVRRYYADTDSDEL
ncbi:MAG: hypothetical protein GY862_07135 [Gammaproteobacteria bacterium]|nr:hypothetical protein [Gammaproteobacteria bacterium]